MEKELFRDVNDLNKLEEINNLLGEKKCADDNQHMNYDN